MPLNIEQALRFRTRLVRTSKIAAQRESVRVLKLDTVRELIESAVDEALENSDVRLDSEERDRILEESERRFQELTAQAKAEKEGVEEQRRRLEVRLERARKQLDRERDLELGAARFTLSAEGIDEIERRIGDRLDRAIDRGRVEPGFEAELRSVVEGILDGERTRIRDLAAHASNDRIDLLEQKITRLARSLSDTQRERDDARQRAHALEISGGGLPVKNVFQPGINGDDPNVTTKLAVLAELVRENHDLRRSIEESGRPIPRIRGPRAPRPEASPEASSS